MLFGKVIGKSEVEDATGSTNPTLADIGNYALKSIGDHQEEADIMVNSMKQKYGKGISSLIMIYNASGRTMRLHPEEGDAERDIHGHQGEWPKDSIIGNGQWSVFLHVHSSGAARGSAGFCHYKFDNTDSYFKVSWDTPFSGKNKAKAEIIVVNNPQGERKLDDKLRATVNIGDASSPKLVYVVEPK